MDQYSTNKISLQTSNKFRLIQKNFIQLSNITSNSRLKKNKTISIFVKRPNLRAIHKLYNEKKNIKSQLDQIGKEDSIFNNDKLITNIQLETLDDITINDILDQTTVNRKVNFKNKNDISNIKQYQSPKKDSKRWLTPLTKTTGKRKKINNHKKEDSNVSNLTLELNCNKMPQKNNSSTKINNYKNSKKKVITKTNQKNLNAFINKPKNKKIKNNLNDIQLKNVIATPINNKNKRSKKMYNNSSFTKLSDSCEITNDSLCLTTVSKVMAKTYTKSNSVSMNKKLTNMHFPNKSNIKNKDKLLNELQKLFTDKMQLNDETYQKMTDLDKKNCIIFLLESVKEMFTINKMTQNKNEDFREMNKAKEKKIQDDKNEIKELKKDIIKLNKIIKTNILLNRKLSQKVDNLKIQLEKEKNKNKDSITKRNITTENKFKIKNKIKYRNKINEFVSPDLKIKLMNKSMEKIKNNNMKIDEKNYQCNKDNKINDEKVKKENNDYLLSKEKKHDKTKKQYENDFNQDLLLKNNLSKEKKGLSNNSDCTNFSDANNGIVE